MHPLAESTNGKANSQDWFFLDLLFTVVPINLSNDEANPS